MVIFILKLALQFDQKNSVSREVETNKSSIEPLRGYSCQILEGQILLHRIYAAHLRGNAARLWHK